MKLPFFYDCSVLKTSSPHFFDWLWNRKKSFSSYECYKHTYQCIWSIFPFFLFLFDFFFFFHSTPLLHGCDTFSLVKSNWEKSSSDIFNKLYWHTYTFNGWRTHTFTAPLIMNMKDFSAYFLLNFLHKSHKWKLISENIQINM